MGRQKWPDLAFSSVIGKFWIICIFLNTWTLSLFGFCPFRSPPLPFFLFILSLKDLLAWRCASNYLSWSKLSTGDKATPCAAHRCEHRCLQRVMQLKGKSDKPDSGCVRALRKNSGTFIYLKQLKPEWNSVYLRRQERETKGNPCSSGI